MNVGSGVDSEIGETETCTSALFQGKEDTDEPMFLGRGYIIFVDVDGGEIKEKGGRVEDHQNESSSASWQG